MNIGPIESARNALEIVRDYESVLDDRDYPDGDPVEDFNSACDALEHRIDSLAVELETKEDHVSVPKADLERVLEWVADDSALDGHYPEDSEIASAIQTLEEHDELDLAWPRYAETDADPLEQ